MCPVSHLQCFCFFFGSVFISRTCCMSDSPEMWHISDGGLWSNVKKNSREILNFIHRSNFITEFHYL